VAYAPSELHEQPQGLLRGRKNEAALSREHTSGMGHQSAKWPWWIKWGIALALLLMVFSVLDQHAHNVP
jgi:hypothetical protein